MSLERVQQRQAAQRFVKPQRISDAHRIASPTCGSVLLAAGASATRGCRRRSDEGQAESWRFRSLPPPRRPLLNRCKRRGAAFRLGPLTPRAERSKACGSFPVLKVSTLEVRSWTLDVRLFPKCERPTPNIGARIMGQGQIASSCGWAMGSRFWGGRGAVRRWWGMIAGGQGPAHRQQIDRRREGIAHRRNGIRGRTSIRAAPFLVGPSPDRPHPASLTWLPPRRERWRKAGGSAALSPPEAALAQPLQGRGAAFRLGSLTPREERSKACGHSRA